MKKALFILLSVLFIAGCSEEAAPEEVNAEEQEQTEDEFDEAETEPFADREPLPFDVNQFNELYKSKYEERFGDEEGTNIVVRDETIAMLEGSANEALIMLYTLNELTNENTLGEYAEQFATDIFNDTYYVDETVIDGLEIHINAVDINYVAITVFNGE